MADDPWEGYAAPTRGRGTDDPFAGFAAPVGRQREAPYVPEPIRSSPKEEEAPTLLESGWEGLKGDLRTGGARLVNAAGFPETAKSIQDQAEKNYETAARRPVGTLADAKSWTDYPKMLYEGAIQSAPSMAPVLAGGAAGSVFGPLGALAGGLAAGIPQFFGANLKRQMEEQKIPLEQTDMGTAGIAAVAQAAFDSGANVVTLGMGKLASPMIKLMGKEMTERVIVRAAARGLEGVVSEGISEAAQQAIEILQANPEKLWQFSPEVQNEIATAAFIGAGVGGALGGAHGALHPPKRDPPQPYGPPTRDEVVYGPPERYGPPEQEVPYGPPERHGPPERGDVVYGPPTRDDVVYGPPNPEYQPDWSPNYVSNEPAFPESEHIDDSSWEDAGVAPGSPFEPPASEPYGPPRPPPPPPPPPGGGRPDWSPNVSNEPAFPESEHIQEDGGWDEAGVAPGSAFDEPTPKAYGPPRPPPAKVDLSQPFGRNPQEAMAADQALSPSPGIPTDPRIPPPPRVPPKQSAPLNESDQAAMALTGHAPGTALTPTETVQAAEQAMSHPEVAQTVPSMQAKRSGERIEKDLTKQLIAAGRPAGEAKAAAKIVRRGYERLGTLLKADPWTLLYGKDGKNFSVQQGKGGPRGGKTFNQDDTARAQALWDKAAQLQKDAYAPTALTPRAATERRAQMLAEAKVLRAEAQKLLGHTDRDQQGTAAEKEPRGRIRVVGNRTIIQLLNADPSTFMHEAGHHFLEEYIKYAKHSPEIAADLKDIYQWLGVEDGHEPNVLQHEKFARGFERWLADGKAPSPGLAGVFRQFAKWLAKVYETVANRPEAIPPHIAKLYDRLMAADERGEKIFEQEALKRTHPNAKPIQLKQLAQASPTKSVRFIVDKNGVMTAGDAGTFTHDQLMYPGGHTPSDHAEIERDWNNVAVRGFVHEINDGKYEYELSDPQDPIQELKHPIAERLERAGIKHWQDSIGDHRPGPRGGRLMLDENSSSTGDERVREFNQDPLVHATDFMSKAAGKAKAFAKAIYYADRTLDPLGNVPHERELTERRGRAIGKAGVASDEAKRLGSIFRDADQQQQREIYNYFTTRDALPNAIELKYRPGAVEAKRLIEQLGQQMVDRKMLPADVYEAHKGEYLPRVYLTYLLEHKGITTSGFRMNLSEQKARKLENSPEERQILGETENPAILVQQGLARMGRDIAMFDYMDGLAGADKSEWIHPRSTISFAGQRVTPEFLTNHASLIRTRLAPAAEKIGEHEKAAEMLKRAEEMEAAANEAYDARKQDPPDPDTFKRMPDTNQYGILRGAWVQKNLADDISGAVDFSTQSSAIAKLIGDKNSWLAKAVQYWKIGKVPLSPASQARNFVGNLVQSNLAGGIKWRHMASGLSETIRDMRANGQYTQIAREYGLLHSTMAETELHELSNLVAKGFDKGTGVMAALRIGPLFHKAMEKSTGLYQLSEALFKTMIVRDAMLNQRKKDGSRYTAAEAAHLADASIYDYSRVSPSVKWLRNSPLGMPFITWQVKTLGMLAQVAREHPTRFLPYFTFMMAAPMITASMSGLSADDQERLRMALPEGLRRKSKYNMLPLPYKDANNNWVFADLGYFYPWQMPYEFFSQLGQGNYGEAYKALNLFSNPAINVIQAAATGVDPFTQHPIADKRDPISKQVGDVMTYARNLVLPSVFAEYGAMGKLSEKLQGTGLNRYGEPTNTTSEIVARAFGMNTYPVAPEAQRARNILHLNTEIQQVRSRLTYEMRDQSKSLEQRQRIAGDYQAKIRELQQGLIKYQQESAMTPNLREKSRP